MGESSHLKLGEYLLKKINSLAFSSSYHCLYEELKLIRNVINEKKRVLKYTRGIL